MSVHASLRRVDGSLKKFDVVDVIQKIAFHLEFNKYLGADL